MWLRHQTAWCLVLGLGAARVLGDELLNGDAKVAPAVPTDGASVDVDLPTPSPEPVGAAAEGAELTAQALVRLQQLVQRESVSDAGGLLERAQKLKEDASTKSKAVPLLEALVAAANSSDVPRSNSSEAALELGTMHLTGDGVPRNVTLAVKHFELAAEHGHPESQNMLGVLYSTGFGVPQHGALAATHYHFAAEGGSTSAQLALGYRHLLGVGSPKEFEKALLYYDPVAERVVAGTQRGKAQQVFEKVRLSIDNPKGTSKHGAAEDEVREKMPHATPCADRRRGRWRSAVVPPPAAGVLGKRVGSPCSVARWVGLSGRPHSMCRARPLALFTPRAAAALAH